ncbi:hypothetical protein [Brevundimonas aveniformis]|uniref:hypothetical protein n=1 Tax=Brevundimonas aveniformis TaxID=370977 RepID=UPI00048C5341|nr:hypothetical protein [Brevundimonas aveniformis]
MDNQRLVLILGGVAAILTAGLAAILLTGGPSDRDREDTETPPERAGLQLNVSDPESLSPDQQLRCFVGGQFVGMATLADCAQRNGVASQALDVGLDSTGALTAIPFTPPPELPPLVDEPDPMPVTEQVDARPVEPRPGPQAQQASGQRCMRHAGGEWREVGTMSLGACVQSLYGGRCEQLGGASYGRWGDTTLRLVPGRVEQSSDNTNFRAIAPQGRDCSIGDVR